MDLLAVYYPDSYVLLKGETNSLCIAKLGCRDYRDIIFYKQDNRNISKKGRENGYDETRRSQKTEVKSIV